MLQIVLAFGLVVTASACTSAAADPGSRSATAERAASGPAVVAFRVGGMACERCADRLREGMLHVDGVIVVDVQIEAQRLAVTYDPAKVDEGRIASEAEKLGFEVTDETR